MTDSVTVTVPVTLDGVRQALDEVDALLGRRQVPDAIRRQALTALDEVLANIVRHGPAGGAGSIWLTVSPPGPRLEVEVADAGPPFDPLGLARPDTSGALEERRPGGLGIMLVRALADDVRYERRDDRNHVTMGWRMRPVAGEDSHADQ